MLTYADVIYIYMYICIGGPLPEYGKWDFQSGVLTLRVIRELLSARQVLSLLTCITNTNVKMLTPDELLEVYRQMLRLLALLVQRYQT